LSRNLGTLTSWNPVELSRPVMELSYLLLALYVVFGRIISILLRNTPWAISLSHIDHR